MRLFFKVYLLILLCLLFQPSMVMADNLNISPPTHKTLKGDITTARKYILGPNDVLSVSIYNAPQFNQESIRIQPDGGVIITPLGSIKVSGMSIQEFYELLNEKFKRYIKKPDISLKLVQPRPFIVYVNGAVINPGSYELNTITNVTPFFSKPETFIERKTPLLTNIIVAAGGISFDADLEHIQITNNIDGSHFEVNLLSLIDEKDTNQDIYLMSGDNVFVPKLPSPLAVNIENYKKIQRATFSPQSVSVKVIGYVNNPGLVKLDTTQPLTLTAAIAAAGGYLKDSAYAPKRIYLSRADTSGKLVTKIINPKSSDAAILPNDIIYVPEKAIPKTGKFFDFMSRLTLPIYTTASMYTSLYDIFTNTQTVRVKD